ncbi:L-rhamnose mutarotase [Halanaerobium saccharolyticum]|uniref:L-rhamnose mutarotase n=1 Tax=Halanaerobium saccharolyticum TaxID=43595 RepID=A0A4V3CET6_9FIRM|nr:L-rhamnose mutarotase [Halanaerobium saccharolyticum]TDO90050.1 L-rhamnose mutarotase [Halanaerobium saccharolyticum]
MQRFGFKLFLKDESTTEEYKKRHDEIWPEMLEVLDKAGIKNYSIWNSGRELFGYYECQDGEYADRIQAESEIVAKWNHYMEDLLVSEENEEGKLVPVIEPMELMFYKK